MVALTERSGVVAFASHFDHIVSDKSSNSRSVRFCGPLPVGPAWGSSMRVRRRRRLTSTIKRMLVRAIWLACVASVCLWGCSSSRAAQDNPPTYPARHSADSRGVGASGARSLCFERGPASG